MLPAGSLWECILVWRNNSRRQVTDTVDRQTRSRMMAGIMGKDTKPELALRRALHRLGFRFRLHAKGLPGRPDIILPKYSAAIFVHGCFWHRHADCRYTTKPKSRIRFWQKKFKGNVERDFRNRAALENAGWRVAIVWECALRKPEKITMTAGRVGKWLKTRKKELEI
jgi:DNA mismatch endonuclease (patch repair protein)